MRNRIGRESERNSAARQNCQSVHRLPEPNQPTTTRSLGLLVVATLAVVFVLRAGWLACVPVPTDLRLVTPSAYNVHSKTTFAEAGREKERSEKEKMETPGRLSAEDFVMLSTVCPTAIDSLPPELLPLQQLGNENERTEKHSEIASTEKLAPPHRLTAAHSPRASQPTARITGVRVASRPDWSRQSVRLAQADGNATESASGEGWLVSPDVWFVPEDREKNQPDQEAEQQETEQQEPNRQVADPSEVFVEDETLVEDAAVEQSPQIESSRDWPVLPPKPVPVPDVVSNPATLPEPDSSPEITQTPEVVSEESSPLPGPMFSKPLDSQGPLHSEPDFIAEPEGAVGEEIPAEETPAPLLPATPSDESPAVEKSKTEPLFAAPRVDNPQVVPSESPKREQPPRTPPSLSAPATVQAPGKIPSPKPTLPAERGPVVEEGIKAKEIAPIRSIPKIELSRPQPTVTSSPKNASPPASTHLFAPPSAAPSVRPSSPPSVHGAGAAVAARKAAGGKSADLSHAELFSKNCYPSAKDCAKCHEKIYDEWSLSSHAYAYVSPMFHKFEQKINDLSQGTVGTFCLRCHSPPGISMAPLVGQTRTTPISEVSEVSRDGVGCISCHRVNERYGKVNGERRIVTGDLFDPVYGGLGGDGVAAAIADKAKYKLKTSASEKGPGQAIHNEGRFFDQLTRSEACVSCHQVAVHPGIKLEVVWEQYRASPACEKGVSCQDCHMGRVPGVPAGYNYGPIAEVAGKTVRTDRKQSNHSFYGPGYSIAHPGIFPQHQKSDRWNIDQWVLFDWRAGWGTEDFEDRIEEAEDAGQNVAAMFPPIWREVDDRYDARDIIEDNLEKLKIKRRQRELVMENGSKVDGPFFRDAPVAGQDLKFEYIVTNLNEGHNLPTASLGAQPQLWANIVLIGPDGRRVWESGYTDSYGDVCDIHSEDVQKGRAPYDSQLFNLQTMFMITGATGTDREFYLPVNLSIDQVAQLRPGGLPISVLNHPPFIRMENRSIAPLGKKRARYRIPAEVLCQPGHYRLTFRLRSRLEPMYFMRFVGATEEMQRAMNEGILDVHPMSVEFEVKAPLQTARKPATNGGWMR